MTAERDALALVQAAETDRPAAAAVLASLDPEELLEVAVALVSVVPVLRRLRPGLALHEVCRLLLDSPDGTAGAPDP